MSVTHDAASGSPVVGGGTTACTQWAVEDQSGGNNTMVNQSTKQLGSLTLWH